MPKDQDLYSNNLQHAHDKSFKRMLSHPRIAKEMLEQHLPTHLLNILDLESLEISKSSYIDERLRESASDILYQLKTRDANDCYVYALIEHQSSPDKNMMLRFLKYSCSILEDHQRQHQSKLPIIMPLLVYNGVQSPYPFSMDLLDYFADRQLAERMMFKPAHLIDLSVIPDRELLQHKRAISFAQMLLKHMRARDFCTILEQLVGHLRDLSQPKDRAILKTLIECSALTTQLPDVKRYHHLIKTGSPEPGEQLMTFAQHYHHLGMKEGIQGKQAGIDQVKQQVAENMIKEGFTADMIAKLSGLNIIRVKRLMNKLSKTVS